MSEVNAVVKDIYDFIEEIPSETQCYLGTNYNETEDYTCYRIEATIKIKKSRTAAIKNLIERCLEHIEKLHAELKEIEESKNDKQP